MRAQRKEELCVLGTKLSYPGPQVPLAALKLISIKCLKPCDGVVFLPFMLHQELASYDPRATPVGGLVIRESVIGHSTLFAHVLLAAPVMLQRQ